MNDLTKEYVHEAFSNPTKLAYWLISQFPERNIHHEDIQPFSLVHTNQEAVSS
ncbi:MAG: hypothetical protein Q4C49_06220 [Bacillota bacterium]|nr:hypothetical protein [Bacillota bacterium]